MIEVDEGVASVNLLVVCHPEPLMAEVIAAAMQGEQEDCRVIATATLSGALTALRSPAEAALVFDRRDEDVVELFEALNFGRIATPVVIVADSRNPTRAALLLESGASGVVGPDYSARELWGALRTASLGKMVIDGAIQSEVVGALRSRRIQRTDAQRILARLKPTDLTILRMLCEGSTVARMAERLALSPFTVRGHVRAIGSVVGAHGQLAIAAVGRRLFAAARLPLGESPHPERGRVQLGHPA